MSRKKSSGGGNERQGKDENPPAPAPAPAPKQNKRDRWVNKGKVPETGDLYHVGLRPGSLHSCTIGGIMFSVEGRAYSSPTDSVGQKVYGSVIRMNKDRKEAVLKAIDKRWVQWEGTIDTKDDPYRLPGQDSGINGIGPDGNRTRCRIVVEGTSGFQPNENMEPIEDYLYFYPIVSEDQQLSGPKPSLTKMKSGASEDQLMAEAKALAEAHERKLEEIKRVTEEAARQKIQGVRI